MHCLFSHKERRVGAGGGGGERDRDRERQREGWNPDETDSAIWMFIISNNSPRLSNFYNASVSVLFAKTFHFCSVHISRSCLRCWQTFFCMFLTTVSFSYITEHIISFLCAWSHWSLSVSFPGLFHIAPAPTHPPPGPPHKYIVNSVSCNLSKSFPLCYVQISSSLCI